MKNREFNHLHNMCIKFEKECVYVCVWGGGGGVEDDKAGGGGG